ncbi:MAG: HD domain-containing phosphohydrolase, partial [Verrucomicrobiota bacterium]
MKKILFVDDDPRVLTAVRAVLRRQFSVETALGPEEGLFFLQDWRDFAVVVSDMQMPKMNGVEFLNCVRDISPDLVRILHTASNDQASAVSAVNEAGIFRFLKKPCPNPVLIEALSAAMRQYHSSLRERELSENTLQGSVKVLLEILSMAEPKSFGQAQMLRDNARLLAQTLEMTETRELEVAALLSQIGSVTIPREVLQRQRAGHPLAAREQEMISSIPAIGCNLLAQIPRLEKISEIILYQNKCFDGSGFPQDKIAGKEIPMGARILKILSALAEREGQGMTRPAAIHELERRPDWYDPEIVDVLNVCFNLYYPKAGEETAPPVALNFPNLRVGHLLRSDVETKNGVLIVSAGSVVSATLMQRLRNFSLLSGLQEPIYVEA